MCISKMKEIKIMKFGGSCLKDSQSFTKTLNIIKQFQKEDTRLIFICSAVSGMTNFLLETAKKVENPEINSKIFIDEIKEKHSQIVKSVINDENAKDALNFIDKLLEKLKLKLDEIQREGLSDELLEYVMGYGERFSTYIFTSYLKSKGISAQFISADEDFIIISPNNLPIMDLTEKLVKEKINPLLSKKIAPVITGYIAKTQDGKVITLGRGGSDLTTTLVASSLQSGSQYELKVILWKDVHGLYSSDPKFANSAKLIPYISYAEARELAFFGTKILHPLCIFPAERKKVPIEISSGIH